MFPSTKPIVCYVTDGQSFSQTNRSEELLTRIQAAVAAGVDWIQIREKDLCAREQFALARKALAVASSVKTRVLVNDRVDIALAAGANGVHLRQESLPVRIATEWLRRQAPSDFLLGVSCHSVNSAQQAERDGANYVFFGPIFDTPSKQKFGPPKGINSLTRVCNTISIPVIAIGGLTTESALECIQAGASGVAAIRLFQQGGDPRNLRAAIAKIHGAR
jgi:thiamine-phosphate pyrophosphorylase